MESLATLPKYETYKNSGVDWLGHIPANWSVTKLKFLDLVKMGQSPDANNCNDLGEGLSFLQGNAEFGVTTPTAKLWCCKPKKICNKGDILFSVRAPVGALNIADQAYVIGRGLASITTDEKSRNFRKYQLLSVVASLRKLSTGSTFEAISTEDLKNIVLAQPSTSHKQTAIANFLDQKTAQLDEAIGIKEKQIALLKERKQILIQKAVTQGLNPNVPMKDSGVDWIGQIPENWEIRRSKFLFNQRKERAWKNDVQLSATQKYGVIPQEQYEALSGSTVVKIQFHLDKRKHVEKNDFVISMRSFQGGLERAWSQGCIRSSYVILKALEEVDPAFYGYLFKLPKYIKALQRTASFIRDGQDLNFNNYSKMKCL